MTAMLPSQSLSTSPIFLECFVPRYSPELLLHLLQDITLRKPSLTALPGHLS